MESDAKESSWFWLIFTTVLLGGLWYTLSGLVDIAEVSSNWPKYRCSPGVMPFASMYGYDTTQNFNYCLKAIFEGQVGGVTGPFATILATMMKSLMTFLENINSMRIMIATLVGGIVKTIQEFADRFKLLFSQIKFAFLKMQMIMKRLFGSFHAVIYMGLSAIQVGSNFSETFIFKFLDTFCFAPETKIRVLEKGEINIDEVQLNDRLEDDSVVISVYKFLADGQQMVNLHGIDVSTNHFVNYDGKYIEAKDHPDSIPAKAWSGGISRPLICLDTTKHNIPIKDLIFSDWDENTDIDHKYMENNEFKLNGKPATNKPRPWIFQPALEQTTKIVYKNGTINTANNLQLGDILSCGKVVGIGRRLINTWTVLPSGAIVTPSTLVWNKNQWVRAGHISGFKNTYELKVFYTFTVLGTATIELSTGEYIRDNCEIHSPDTEGIIRSLFKATVR